MEIMAPPGMEEMTEQIKSMFSGANFGRKKSRKLKIKDAMKLLIEEEAAKLINEDEMKQEAIRNVEQNGIVFWMRSTRSRRVVKRVALKFRVPGYSAIFCLWLRVRP